MFITSNLKYLRNKFLFTQAHMADEIGVSRVTYNNYESGRLEVNIPTLIKLSQKYGVSMDEIINSDLSLKNNSAIISGGIIIGNSNHGTINHNEYIPLTSQEQQEVINEVAILRQKVGSLEQRIVDLSNSLSEKDETIQAQKQLIQLLQKKD
jgi:DNA-binding XRE family transcriptional regulator